MKLKALIHVNEAARFEMALGNIANLLEAAVGDDVEVVVVANGEGVKGYVSCVEDASEKVGRSINATDRISTMEDLARKGVSFIACRNALAAHNIATDTLPSFVTVVPAGMVQLIKLQAGGFAYIKP